MPRFFVDSLDDPRLAPYQQLKTSNLTRWSGLFIAEGWRVTQRLLESDYEVQTVLVTDHKLPSVEDWITDQSHVLIMPRALAEQLVGYNFHSGILACGIRRDQTDLESLLQTRVGRTTLVICPRITDPDNLGTIIRLCTAFGVDGILLGNGSAEAFSRRTLRVSMGHAFSMPIFENRDMSADLNSLKQQFEFDLVATVLDADAEHLAEARREERLALVFGNEAEGLDPQIVSQCGRKVTIPMDVTADSLNVAVAAGIFLHHFTRMV